jgi:hypothetical protein
MNLGQIELGVYDRLNFNSTPDSALARRVRRYINDAHREILGKREFGQLRRNILTCSSVANSPLMVLPQAAVAIIIISDRATNRTLDVISLADVRFRDPGLKFTSSIPDSYCVINYASVVAADPSVGDSLFVISDAAADGSGLAVNIEGTVTGGYYRRASVALNGLVAVNINATITTWEHITKFYISGTAVGNVTLLQTSGAGPELARISPGHTYPRYTLIHLAGTPSTSATYYCDVEMHVEDMRNINDEPLLPEDYHWLLETGVLKREYMKREKMAQWKVEQQNWMAGLADMGAFLRRRGGVSKGGQRGQNGRQFNQLNSPWFSA